jgi:hypothetical protein
MRLLVCGTTLSAVGIIGPGTTRASRPPATIVSVITPITATFVQAEFATHYTVRLRSSAGNPTDRIEVRWTLAIACIDPGCPNKNGTLDHPLPDRDAGCNNHGVGTKRAYDQALFPGRRAEFVWHHGDFDGCNHAKEGPRGHQGIITVAATDGRVQCTATYKGTVTSTPTSIKDGTASRPKCGPASRPAIIVPRLHATLCAGNALLVGAETNPLLQESLSERARWSFSVKGGPRQTIPARSGSFGLSNPPFFTNE